eukprot:TRINITY_DN3113_c0_g1_i15.p1 TRINITY_DN3113_c0_g1~~TRINITY_DN3113_c0_g1_i15.p1  ORF type:complete len:389 (+),score=65.79 TRINITY_DN3113_c0_g1_i15:905-2071(+)
MEGDGTLTKLKLLHLMNNPQQALQFLLTNRNWMTPSAEGTGDLLYLAVKNNHLEIVKALVEQGVQIRSEHPTFTEAAKKGNTKILDLLDQSNLRKNINLDDPLIPYSTRQWLIKRDLEDHPADGSPASKECTSFAMLLVFLRIEDPPKGICPTWNRAISAVDRLKEFLPVSIIRSSFAGFPHRPMLPQFYLSSLETSHFSQSHPALMERIFHPSGHRHSIPLTPTLLEFLIKGGASIFQYRFQMDENLLRDVLAKPSLRERWRELEIEDHPPMNDCILNHDSDSSQTILAHMIDWMDKSSLQSFRRVNRFWRSTYLKWQINKHMIRSRDSHVNRWIVRCMAGDIDPITRKSFQLENRRISGDIYINALGRALADLILRGYFLKKRKLR